MGLLQAARRCPGRPRVSCDQGWRLSAGQVDPVSTAPLPMEASVADSTTAMPIRPAISQTPAHLPHCALSPRAAVAIAPSLCQQSPQNGNICGQGWRLWAFFAPGSASRESGDKIKCAKPRHFRPYLALLRETGRTQDCLAGAGVLIAPVSGLIPC
jgi:hypothetical protein